MGWLPPVGRGPSREGGTEGPVEEGSLRIYFPAKVEEGLRQADTGQTVDSEEARKRILG